jgi:hypothetical protein
MNAHVGFRGATQNRVSSETNTYKEELLISSTPMVNEIETVTVYRVGGGHGTTIEKKSYYAMADAILSLLLVKEELSLVDLVNSIKEIDVAFKADTNWLLLQVKQDLEQKGFIKSFLRDKSPFVLLKRKAFLKSEFKNALILQTNDKSRMSCFF